MLSASRQHYLFTDEQTVLKVEEEDFASDLSDMVFVYLKYGESGK